MTVIITGRAQNIGNLRLKIIEEHDGLTIMTTEEKVNIVQSEIEVTVGNGLPVEERSIEEPYLNH
jgi:hypothetical protein